MTTATSKMADTAAKDDSWPMIEEAVFRLFEEIAAEGSFVRIRPRLDELGWSDIELEYPTAANALLFEAQGRSLAVTDALDRTMIAELTALVGGPVNGVVLPTPGSAGSPATTEQRVTGIVLGPPVGRLVVPMAGSHGTISLGVVDAAQLSSEPLDTFDPSVQWARVEGRLEGTCVEGTSEWNRAVAAAQRSLGTELVALADRALHVAIEHISARVQFGAPIGSLQSPRHALADAAATVKAARALLDESWQYGGRLSALTAKAAAGRAHRAVVDATLQVCGAIGLTAEHSLHRYVSRGFQIDALCGSYDETESMIATYLFDVHPVDRALPSIITWT